MLVNIHIFYFVDNTSHALKSLPAIDGGKLWVAHLELLCNGTITMKFFQGVDLLEIVEIPHNSIVFVIDYSLNQ